MRKIILGLVVVAIVAYGAWANMNRTPSATQVQAEKVERRDLAAVVTGSGKIRPAKEVDISSNVMGQITRLDVEEGDVVQTGDFLLRIDPVRYQSQVEQVEAQIAAATTNLELARENLAYARDILDRREGLYQQDLLAKEAYLDAVQSVQREERTVMLREQELQRLQAQLAASRHDLSMVSFSAPIAGVITKLNVEEGETAVTGTMNNPGTILMTIADLSVVEAEIEIDETDIVNVEVGQPAEVRIDAFADRVFAAEVIEVGKSPITATAATQAINFKVVVRVTETVPGARPGLSCTADIVTATRQGALSVPIQSLILREVRVDENGDIVERDPMAELIAAAEGADPATTDASELQEIEGAFVVDDGRADFRRLEIGIAGERHFEVLSGLAEGEEVVIGPFDVIRTLQSGDAVELRSTISNRDQGGD